MQAFLGKREVHAGSTHRRVQRQGNEAVWQLNGLANDIQHAWSLWKESVSGKVSGTMTTLETIFRTDLGWAGAKQKIQFVS
jgi:hypothetical protein